MSAQPHVLVVLSGSGFLDGAEITEAVVSLLALSRAGATTQVAAPDKPQAHVVDHRTGQVEEGASRNVLTEAARIARGAAIPLSEASADDYDAIFLPGGYGAAKNLSTFAFDGPSGTVDPDLSRLLSAFRAAGKPIGAVCISPAVLVLALGEGTVTIGSDAGTAAAIEGLGGTHQSCGVTEIAIDEERRIVTAPAYMVDADIADVATGIERAVAATIGLIG